MNQDIQKAIARYNPEKEAIGQLLALTNPSLIVPEWQRNYSWKSEHVEAFWNDLNYFMKREGSEPKGEYFLGSVVIVKTNSGEYKLLDGQQRLATSAMLLSVIRDEVKTFNEDASKQIQRDYLVGYDHVSSKTIHKLRLNRYDQEFFRKLVLDSRDGNYTEPKAKIASHKLILNTRKIFERLLSEYLDGRDPKARFRAAMYVSQYLLRHMTVISVYSTDEESAAEVFETLNDRGIGLSTPDLLRNLVIRRADENQRNTVVELWHDVVSFETDSKIKNFLRHFWVSHHGDVKSQSLYREIKGVIEEQEIKSVKLSTDLSEASKTYRTILMANTDDAKFNKCLSDASEFGASSAILNPVFLGLYESLKDEPLVDAATCLLNVFVRHSVILNRENSQLENAIYAAIRKLREKKDHKAFIQAISSFSPTDDEVRNAFERLALKHNGTRRSVLTRFELDARQTEELDVADPSRVHVEHIYPQTPKQGEAWEDHHRLVDRLGNLTLLSARLNKSIKNGSFAQKRDAFIESEIKITRELAKNVGWSKTLMESRQKEMAKKAPSLWPV